MKYHQQISVHIATHDFIKETCNRYDISMAALVSLSVRHFVETVLDGRKTSRRNPVNKRSIYAGVGTANTE